MKRIKGIIFGLVVGIPLGMWFGFNLGTERPLLSNPFKEPTIQDTIRRTGENLMEKSGEVLEKSGRALQEKAGTEEDTRAPQQYPPQ